MAVAKKFVVAPSAATRELWRVAESGELDELGDLLPRADINARNEHGMTALMRAAYHGRVQMVRALLDHGADPNVTRNDNFTALSLAAFFGHTEIVEMLIGYGARTDVATRYGTSAQMWAKARSFGDVARCLQKRRNEEVVLPTREPEVVLRRSEPEVVLPAPQREVAEEEFESVPVVRTLKDPPEIWDLVHEAPRNFSAGTAFVARVGSITAGVVLALGVLSVIAGGIAGVWYWKDMPPQNIRVSESPPPTVPAEKRSTDLPSISVPEPVNTVPEPVVRRNVTRKSAIKPRPTPAETVVESTAATIPPVQVAPKVDSRSSNATANKPAAPLSPQLISPPKTQPKAKVIQWP